MLWSDVLFFSFVKINQTETQEGKVEEGKVEEDS